MELTLRTVKDLKKIKSFNVNLYGIVRAQEIIDAIFELLETLENPTYNFTEIGEIDRDFNHLKYSYRKLIQHHCKITYRQGKTKIYVVRIFDTRQPNKEQINSKNVSNLDS